MSRSRSFVAALVLSACASVAHASPEDDTVVATRRVPVAGADFASPAAVERLYVRLASAARHVCASSIAPQTYSYACASRALDAAVADVGDARLAEVHRQRRGG